MVSAADIRRREAPPAKSLPADLLRPLAVRSSVSPQLYRSCLLWRLAPRVGRSRTTEFGQATAGETREHPALPRPTRPDAPPTADTHPAENHQRSECGSRDTARERPIRRRPPCPAATRSPPGQQEPRREDRKTVDRSARSPSPAPPPSTATSRLWSSRHLGLSHGFCSYHDRTSEVGPGGGCVTGRAQRRCLRFCGRDGDDGNAGDHH